MENISLVTWDDAWLVCVEIIAGARVRDSNPALHCTAASMMVMVGTARCQACYRGWNVGGPDHVA